MSHSSLIKHWQIQGATGMCPQPLIIFCFYMLIFWSVAMLDLWGWHTLQEILDLPLLRTLWSCPPKGPDCIQILWPQLLFTIINWYCKVKLSLYCVNIPGSCESSFPIGMCLLLRIVSTLSLAITYSMRVWTVSGYTLKYLL